MKVKSITPHEKAFGIIKKGIEEGFDLDGIKYHLQKQMLWDDEVIKKFLKELIQKKKIYYHKTQYDDYFIETLLYSEPELPQIKKVNTSIIVPCYIHGQDLVRKYGIKRFLKRKSRKKVINMIRTKRSIPENSRIFEKYKKTHMIRTKFPPKPVEMIRTKYMLENKTIELLFVSSDPKERKLKFIWGDSIYYYKYTSGSSFGFVSITKEFTETVSHVIYDAYGATKEGKILFEFVTKKFINSPL